VRLDDVMARRSRGPFSVLRSQRIDDLGVLSNRFGKGPVDVRAVAQRSQSKLSWASSTGDSVNS
jgi:hypothetical protein